MTSAFVDAAHTMAAALGVPDYPFAVIDHPVSSATDAGLEARARSVCEALRAELEAGGG
jgi:hypothetical protein